MNNKNSDQSNFKNFNHISNISSTCITDLDSQLSNAVITVSIMFTRQNNCSSLILLTSYTLLISFLFLSFPIFSISPALVC